MFGMLPPEPPPHPDRGLERLRWWHEAEHRRAVRQMRHTTVALAIIVACFSVGYAMMIGVMLKS